MKLKQIILFCLINLLITNNAFAFVNCQSKYDSDKRSLPSKRGNCAVCHINPAGGGPQNEFGIAYKQAGFKITDELVAKFPSLFQKPKEEPTPAPPSSSGSQVKQPTPKIKRIKPNKVKVNVQSIASITGKNFVDGAKAFIDGSEVLTTFKSNVKLVIDFILNTVGVHQVKVQNPDGQESNTAKIKAK